MAKTQKELAGMEAPEIKDIEEAADQYVTVRDKRMKLTTQEIAAKTALIQTVQKHAEDLSEDSEGNKVYRYGDEIVILSDKLNVKVKKAGSDDDGDE